MSDVGDHAGAAGRVSGDPARHEPPDDHGNLDCATSANLTPDRTIDEIDTTSL